MRSLLLKPRVVDDPGLDAALRFERRRREGANLGQHRLVRPRRLPDEVQQRLMLRRDPRRGARFNPDRMTVRSRGAVKALAAPLRW